MNKNQFIYKQDFISELSIIILGDFLNLRRFFPGFGEYLSFLVLAISKMDSEDIAPTFLFLQASFSFAPCDPS